MNKGEILSKGDEIEKRMSIPKFPPTWSCSLLNEVPNKVVDKALQTTIRGSVN